MDDDRETLADLLPDNPIGPLWHVCFVANSFVFPIYARFEKEHGITRMEFVVLFVLAQRGDTSWSDIVRMTGLPKNNISRGITRLVEKGLVERTEDALDRRRAVLVLTAQGRRLFDTLVVRYRERSEAFLATLTAGERDMLARGIRALATNVFGRDTA